MKRNVAFLLLIPLAAALGATVVKLSQIRGDKVASILVSMPDGTIKQSNVMSGISVDPTTGNIIVAAQQTTVSSPPTVSIFNVTSTTPNSFTIPAGKTQCIVTDAIVLSSKDDYTVVNNNVIFNTPAVPGDIVQLFCF